MEIIFGLIGLLISATILVGIPYLVYGNWKRTIKFLKWQFDGDGTVGMAYIMVGLMLASMIFIVLCAINNTIWHIDYWTTEGLWDK